MRAPASTPRVGSSASSTVGLGQQRAREQHLLLVAARERRDGRLHAGRAHVELLDLARRRARPRGRAGRSPRARRAPSASSETFSRTLSGRNRPSAWRSPGRWTMPARCARPGSPSGTRPCRAASPCRCARQQAGERAQELALAVALDAGEADDLARPDLEVDVVEARAARACARAAAARRLGRDARPSAERPGRRSGR